VYFRQADLTAASAKWNCRQKLIFYFCPDVNINSRLENSVSQSPKNFKSLFSILRHLFCCLPEKFESGFNQKNLPHTAAGL